MSDVKLRPIEPDHAAACGRICYQAFKEVAERHGFRADFPSPEVSTQMLQSLTDDPAVFGLVAESAGKILGSNFLWRHDAIAGVGPITIDSQAQSKGVGKLLMQAVLAEGKECASIRLVQDAFNLVSFSLYSALGFDVKEPLVLIEGAIKSSPWPGYQVRPLQPGDLEECANLAIRALGVSRINELKTIPPFLSYFVAIRDSHIVAYASAPHFWPYNHSATETLDDLQALLSGVVQLSGKAPLSFLLPTRNSSLLRWCLSQGMRIVKPMNLMARGDHMESRCCYTPSVVY